MGILLQNGLVLINGEKVKRDILIEGKTIAKIAEKIEEEGHQPIDVTDQLVVPGFIDMHVHLREPGFEAKETIATGTAAAARGGFTTVACMPNTRPVIDTPETVSRILSKAQEEGCVRVLPMGAITVRELGEELTDMQALKEAGIVAVSDDGVGVQSSRMMKEAMLRAASLDLPVVAHCEDDSLAEGGCVHEGIFSEKHGLKGIPSEAESIQVGRDILLAEATGAHYHVCHISTAESVRLVREAKQRGARVSAEVCPHHLLLCDEDIPGADPNYKMNPPLRSRRDREALIEGLKDGSIDIIVTDHAPHTAEEKARGMQLAPFGIVGLETAFPLLYTKLVETGAFTLQEIVDRMTRIPAELFHLPWGRIEEGADADIAVLDLAGEQAVNPEQFLSKGKNTPFAGWKLKGWTTLTICDGSIIWQSEQQGKGDIE
ncbi:dihydroorotase [Aneurinibacillus terranovensis]|uniref:dihydroorotase n=1 Tax=Aneurinibacillus terranovensis TaxID=278991 RepID=UPI00041A336F|nr:dihydroorotase [Aneurinibacillus terranovensis]